MDVATSLQPVTMAGDSSVIPGDAVVAVGHPFDLTNSLTVGVVSQIHRFEDIGGDSEEWLANLIQFDAAVNPGNSGGPLFDENGNVVGMVVATVNPIFGSGVGFAVSIARIRYAANLLIPLGHAFYPFIGIYVSYLTPDYAVSHGLKTCSGALVVYVIPGTEPDQAGIKNGDVITAIDSTTINSLDDICLYFGGAGLFITGSQVVLYIKRGSQELKLNVTVHGITEDYLWIWSEIIYAPGVVRIPGIYT